MQEETDLTNYFEYIRRNIFQFSETDNISELGEYFEEPTTGNEENRVLIKDTASKLDDANKNPEISENICEEATHWNKIFKRVGNPNEKGLHIPTACDNFYVSKKVSSISTSEYKLEFLFLLNFFSIYFDEPIDELEKVSQNILKFDSIIEHQVLREEFAKIRESCANN